MVNKSEINGLYAINAVEEIILSEVIVLVPSRADKLIGCIKSAHINHISFVNSDNSSVKASLESVLG